MLSLCARVRAAICVFGRERGRERERGDERKGKGEKKEKRQIRKKYNVVEAIDRSRPGREDG